ncbi:MAG: VIT1/CCC1 transporter family protein [Candidatus Heimdallarchaeum endolithica]|uniref:VIT1/CCC1 transporter family protein n=1 Tax=Candidatus Heimdallarchaeum endolithica TaxID=2876572 RepID=A0A9Y1BPS9_9ARCH|nr:MAG: VIT1/CCC1 transporter family protein [Candidatus Heimdallarchaeum endolithica]
MLDKKERRIFLKLQKDEATANLIYTKISVKEKNSHNKEILRKIAEEEKKHYEILKSYTKTDVHPNRFTIFLYSLISIIFGITFLVKLLERGEDKAQENYRVFYEKYPPILPIIEDEENHEIELISMIDEERLNYMGSIVLGLNDALVELTGALAGFTFAIKTGSLIALTGLITGISAALSMGASEYLSSKTEGDINAKKSAIYTGFTYLITVFLLIIPFFLLQNQFISLAITLSVAILIIAVFNYYISVTNDEKFIKKFLEMAVISLGVTLISFGIGYLIDKFILN